MRVFCPEHKRGFFVPRQSPIKCGNRGHLIGEFDFRGEAGSPLERQWQYCCNCEHFCPIDFDQNGLERCPVCNRRSSVMYLCHRCFCISFESNTPLQTKNFTLSAEGVPQPSCPGCLQPTSADLREHTCEVLRTSFVTAVNSCPFCSERLDVGPSFPSSVAGYLRRTRAANKINVTFDYEGEVFVPIDDGEFVLINGADDPTLPVVLPRLARFASPRDFYEFYQDFYHCPQPIIGEVQILKPAAVVRVAEGWKLETPGVLEVIKDQPKKPLPTPVPTPRPQEDRQTPKIESVNEPPKKPAATASVSHERPKSETPVDAPVQPCSHCGTLIEVKYGFCWQCGSHLTTEKKAGSSSAQNRNIVASGPVAPETSMLEDDEQTVQHEGHETRRVGSPIISWATANGRHLHRSAPGSVLKLFVVVVVGLVSASIGLFALTRSSSEVVVTAAQPVRQNAEATTGPSPTQQASPEIIAPEPQRAQVQSTGENELKKLRERRIAANGPERSEILQLIARTEKKYPKDYRFPYERAKLMIKVPQRASRQEAFAALSVAAEKAINTGKAREMLENLQKDSRGDFQKLSHGRREWTQLQEALKTQDATVLSEKMGL